MPFKVFKQHGLDFQKLAVTVLEQGKACNTRTSVHNIEPTALFWKALQMGNDCHGIWAKLCMTNAIHALLWFFSLYGVVWEVSGYETVLLREIWSSLPSNQHLKSRFSIHYMFMWHIAWSTWNLEAPWKLGRHSPDVDVHTMKSFIWKRRVLWAVHRVVVHKVVVRAIG